MQVLGEEAADYRAPDARNREHDADVALIAAALEREHDVAHDHLREREQPAAAEPLQRAADDQHAHVGRERAQRRGRDEDRDGDEQHGTPAVDVAQLAVQRGRGGRGEEIRGHHPGEVLDVGKLAPDRRQRGGDNRLIERAEEHRQQDAEHDGADVGMGKRRMVGSRRRRGIHHAVLKAANAKIGSLAGNFNRPPGRAGMCQMTEDRPPRPRLSTLSSDICHPVAATPLPTGQLTPVPPSPQ